MRQIPRTLLPCSKRFLSPSCLDMNSRQKASRFRRRCGLKLLNVRTSSCLIPSRQCLIDLISKCINIRIPLLHPLGLPFFQTRGTALHAPVP